MTDRYRVASGVRFAHCKASGTRRDNQQSRRGTDHGHQHAHPVAHRLRLSEISTSQQIADQNAAGIAQTKGQAHQQILDDIGDGIGGDCVRTQMSHDHGVHGETTSPHQFIAKHRQAVFPEILLQRPIGMQHMAKSQVGATTGRHDRPCQLNRTRNHRGYSRAENAKRGNARGCRYRKSAPRSTRRARSRQPC